MADNSIWPLPAASPSFLRQLYQQGWVVYAKPPFGGAEHVLNYLARYTHRVAISNHRLVAFENDRVSFCWRDYAHGGKKKIITVSAHSSAATCCTSCPAAWFAFDTSESLPTADEVSCWNVAARYLAWGHAMIRPSPPLSAAQHVLALCSSSNG